MSRRTCTSIAALTIITWAAIVGCQSDPTAPKYRPEEVVANVDSHGATGATPEIEPVPDAPAQRSDLGAPTTAAPESDDSPTGLPAAAGDREADDPKAAEPVPGAPKPAKPKPDRPRADPPSEAEPSVDARGLFMKKCKNCHGESGNADTKMGRAHKIPDWTVPGWRTEWPLEKIKDIIEHGKPKTKMKAFEFSDEELDALARYVRSLGR